jgi:hypothetical protein
METKINTDSLDAYRKTYKLRLAQGKQSDRKSIEVTIPYEVIEKEARKRGLTIEEFIKKFQAVAQYNSFEGVLYNFEEIPRGIKNNNRGKK